MLTELLGLAMIGAGLAIKSGHSKKGEESRQLFEEETSANEYQDNDKIVDLEEYRKKTFKRK